MNIDMTVLLLILMGVSTIGLWILYFMEYLWSEQVDEELEMIHELHKNFDKDIAKLKREAESDERVNDLWRRVNEISMQLMRKKK